MPWERLGREGARARTSDDRRLPWMRGPDQRDFENMRREMGSSELRVPACMSRDAPGKTLWHNFACTLLFLLLLLRLQHTLGPSAPPSSRLT